MQQLATAKIIFFIVAASYLVSAVILGVARARGEAVPGFAILGWAITGLLGVVLTALLLPKRMLIWALIALVLGPWMIYALVGDAGEKRMIMSVIDVSGLAAIAYGLWLAWPAMRY